METGQNLMHHFYKDKNIYIIFIIFLLVVSQTENAGQTDLTICMKVCKISLSKLIY